MVKKLPSVIKPKVFAQQRLSFIGNYSLFDLPMVKTVVSKNSGLSISLDFNLVNGLCVATGNLMFTAYIPCVRCLESIKFVHDKKLNLLFGNANSHIPNQFELIEIVDDNSVINTIDFISDEVLLNLPTFAKHNDNCINLAYNCNKEYKQKPFINLK